MGMLVVTEFVSLDGVFEDPGGAEGSEHAGWTFRFDRGEDGNSFKVDEIMAADTLLLGRITYAGFAQAWPHMTDEVGFADKMNGMPKYVVSTTLERPEWNNSQVIRSDVAAEVAALKTRYQGDILVAGSGRLVRSLMVHGLVDEFRLMIFPVVLGSGKRLFAEGTPSSTLGLTGTRPVGPDGVMILTYRPRPQEPAA